MANRDFKKIERIMKDFSLGVGSGSVDTTHLGIEVDYDQDVGELKVYDGDKELEVSKIKDGSGKALFDVVVPLNKEVTIAYKVVSGLAQTYYNYQENSLDFEYDETLEAYTCSMTFTYGGLIVIEDFAVM